MTPEGFWSRCQYDEKTGCLLWTGSRGGNGYGNLYHQGVVVYAHRFAWTLWTGELAPPLLMHPCDTPLCVLHLKAGSQRENVQDALAKGRLKTPFISGNQCARGRRRAVRNPQ